MKLKREEYEAKRTADKPYRLTKADINRSKAALRRAAAHSNEPKGGQPLFGRGRGRTMH